MAHPSTSTAFRQDKEIWEELQKWTRWKRDKVASILDWTPERCSQQRSMSKVSRPTWPHYWLLLQYFLTSLLPCPCFWRKVECAKVGSLISFQDTTLPSNTFFFLYLPLKLGPHPLDQILPSQPTILSLFRIKWGSFQFFILKSWERRIIFWSLKFYISSLIFLHKLMSLYICTFHFTTLFPFISLLNYILSTISFFRLVPLQNAD